MKFYYLVHFQFLGFRYHGWQKQPDLKSVQQAIEESLIKYLRHDHFKIMGASRTDSMVSANHSIFELISESEIKDSDFVQVLNRLLPADIKILKMEETDRHFKIISGAKLKEYIYLFSCGEKNHPFAAPFITHINEELDLPLMMEAAKCFEGRHFFKNYCYRPRGDQLFHRQIELCEIVENDILTANFFPKKSFAFRVQAQSFMRYQVRMMMGGLFMIGMKKVSIAELKKSLKENNYLKVMIAPASGLTLNRLTLE